MVAHLGEVEEVPLAEANMVDGTMRLAHGFGLWYYQEEECCEKEDYALHNK